MSNNYHVELTEYVNGKPNNKLEFDISRSTIEEVVEFFDEHITKLIDDRPNIQYAKVIRDEGPVYNV